MSIFGIGTDIISVDRIKNSLKNRNFINRIFNEKEILKCKKTNNSTNCFAKRFAAKEAFSKAIGTGITKGINLSEIIVQNNNKGKPNIKLIGQTKIVVSRIIKKRFKILLTLSDDRPFAIATVIISL